MGIDVWCVIFRTDDGEYDAFAFNNEDAAEWCKKGLEKKGYHARIRQSALFDQVAVGNRWHGEINNIYCASQLGLDTMRNSLIVQCKDCRHKAKLIDVVRETMGDMVEKLPVKVPDALCCRHLNRSVNEYDFCSHAEKG